MKDCYKHIRIEPLSFIKSFGDDMGTNLLILGAGQYGTVVKGIAESMGCFPQGYGVAVRM